MAGVWLKFIQVATPLALALVTLIGQQKLALLEQHDAQAMSDREDSRNAGALLFSAANPDMPMDQRWSIIQVLKNSPSPAVGEQAKVLLKALAETCGGQCNLVGLDCATRLNGRYDDDGTGRYTFYPAACHEASGSCWKACNAARKEPLASN